MRTHKNNFIQPIYKLSHSVHSMLQTLPTSVLTTDDRIRNISIRAGDTEENGWSVESDWSVNLDGLLTGVDDSELSLLSSVVASKQPPPCPQSHSTNSECMDTVPANLSTLWSVKKREHSVTSSLVRG